MKLFEFEGKKLLEEYKIKTPKGKLFLFNDSEKFKYDPEYPVIKLQVLSGGRGKQGGIKICDSEEEFLRNLENMKKIKINDEVGVGVYCEEKIKFRKEYYLSFTLDRNLKTPILIVSEHGGVDIESVDKEDIYIININPFIGLEKWIITRVSEIIQVEYSKVNEMLENLYKLFKDTKSSLLEINPLFETQEGHLIAGDSKIILEGETPSLLKGKFIKRNNQSFEELCLNIGAVGVQVDEGEIAVITSGAGLGMASYDLLLKNNKSVAVLVDLGGHVIHNIKDAEKLILSLVDMGIKKFFFNYYFQVASSKNMSKAIASTLNNQNFNTIVRVKGKDQEESFKILDGIHNLKCTDDLEDAINIIDREWR